MSGTPVLTVTPALTESYEWVRRFGETSPVIHLQQTNGEVDCHWPFTRTRNEESIIRAPRVLDELRRAGAPATALVLEVIHPHEYDDLAVRQELVESVAYWKQAI